jgi:hypothetical protein
MISPRPVDLDDLSERAHLGPPDLGRVPVLHELLATLNDRSASACALARHIGKFPALEARLSIEYLKTRPGKRLPSLSEQIAVLGNVEVERALLQLLEELTELHACMQEEGA